VGQIWSSKASVLDLGPMYATDVRQKHLLMPPPVRGGGIITCYEGSDLHTSKVTLLVYQNKFLGLPFLTPLMNDSCR